MARRLYLGGAYKKRCVYVDDEDYDLQSLKWNVTRTTKWTKHGKQHYPWKGYVQATVKAFGKTNSIFLHKVIAERKYGYKCPEGFQVDHINRNPKDDRRCNLRYIPREENVRRTAESGKGYCYDKLKKKWQVRFSKSDPFTKKSHVIFSRMCDTENEAKLVARLYKKGYTIPKRRK